MKDMALRVCGTIFLLVAIAHVVRLIFKIEIVAGHYTMPLAFSAAGFLVATALAVWSFYASTQK